MSYEEYRKVATQFVDEALASRRDRDCESALNDAFLLYSFTIEDMRQKAGTNAQVLNDVAISFITLQDLLRGTVHAMSILSPATLATLLRTAFEIRCNLRFIYTSLAPAIFAERFRRFQSASILYNEQHNHPTVAMVSTARRQELLRESDEWIQRAHPDGRFDFSTNWTAEKELKSLRRRAASAGLESQYEGSYAATSQFVHGTALAAKGYIGPDGHINAVGHTEVCRRPAVLCAMNGLHAALEAARFFVWPILSAEFDRCLDRLKARSGFQPGAA